MSIDIMNRVWKYSKQGGSQLLLLLALADNAHDDGFCWPGHEYLAKKIRMSKKSIPRLTKKLQRDGELFINDRSDQGKSIQYVVLTKMTWAEFSKALQTNFRYNKTKILEIRDWFDKVVTEIPAGGDKLGGPQDEGGGVPIAMGRGVDIAMGTKPSLTIKEPSNMAQSAVNDFSDILPTVSPPTNPPVKSPKKLTEAQTANMQVFGVLPDDNPDPEVYAARQELQASGWEIQSSDVELGIVFFVLAVRSQHPDFKIPNDKGTRKDWIASLKAHLQNYKLSDLQDFYNRAIMKLRAYENAQYWRPGSLTKTLVAVANEPTKNTDETDYRDDPQYQAFADLY